MTNYKLIKDSITTVPNFPVKGILFRDITSLIANPQAFQETINAFVEEYRNKDITVVVGTESRGFIFGAPVALALGVPFVLVRKPGKLPRKCIKHTYDLEYGSDSLEIHIDSVSCNDNVLVIDDLLATGGTLSATINLVRELGAKCEHAGFVINLKDLPGKSRLEKLNVKTFSLIEFDGE